MLGAHPARAAGAPALERDDAGGKPVDQVVDRDDVPAVEPHLEHRAVAGQDFRELLAIGLVVGGLLFRGGGASAVSSALRVVTRTKIDAQAHVLWPGKPWPVRRACHPGPVSRARS